MAHDGDDLGVCERVVVRDRAWWRVKRVLVRQKLQPALGARVRWFLAILGWVLLGIGCSVTLCLCFGSWMSRTMRFKSCRECGHDGGDSLLTMTTG